MDQRTTHRGVWRHDVVEAFPDAIQPAVLSACEDQVELLRELRCAMKLTGEQSLGNQPKASSKTFQIFTSTIEITVPSSATNYSCCAFIETAPPQGGPAPHKHDREDEIFMALEGEFEFYADGGWSAMKAGETRVSTRGNYHGFRNIGSTLARMLLVTNGGGIDEYFERIAGLKMPEDFARLTEISEYYGYHFLPPG